MDKLIGHGFVWLQRRRWIYLRQTCCLSRAVVGLQKVGLRCFLSYINEAAEEALGKCYSGHGGKEHKSWWDSEVKEAGTKRKRASKVHRFYKK